MYNIFTCKELRHLETIIIFICPRSLCSPSNIWMGTFFSSRTSTLRNLDINIGPCIVAVLCVICKGNNYYCLLLQVMVHDYSVGIKCWNIFAVGLKRHQIKKTIYSSLGSCHTITYRTYLKEVLLVTKNRAFYAIILAKKFTWANLLLNEKYILTILCQN